MAAPETVDRAPAAPRAASRRTRVLGFAALALAVLTLWPALLFQTFVVWPSEVQNVQHNTDPAGPWVLTADVVPGETHLLWRAEHYEEVSCTVVEEGTSDELDLDSVENRLSVGGSIDGTQHVRQSFVPGTDRVTVTCDGLGAALSPVPDLGTWISTWWPLAVPGAFAVAGTGLLLRHRSQRDAA